ncbi:unnamed protein product [Rotaria sp. Silwood2]|nr:unnamed protein product [Rotaria sp. Silwood2]CAF3183183.1 unnamed protein product [Rotaria sp. Silwood2]CAF3998164.1 unnamed protein product [Rotaria sp. Silwood2]CAF4772002.1 unnamed protein product [Rotaria sp. Silwood2]
MAFIWNEKSNFILIHFVTLHQQQSSTSDINWSSIVKDISLEISSTPTLLKNQYEHLLETLYSEKDPKSLYSTLKHTCLHSLCQKIEDNLHSTLEAVYELIRHARSKRITAEDIEQLLKEWNFDSSSDDQKKNKDRLLNILNRLRRYIQTLPNNDSQSIHHNLSTCSNTNEQSIIQEDIQDEDLEPVSDNDDDISLTYVSKTKQIQLININNDRIVINKIEREKSSTTRRRSQSLTLFDGNKDNKVNIGVEWFVPKLKRQQRSSSLHARCQSPLSIDSLLVQNQNIKCNNILLTTMDNDKSSNLMGNSNVRQTHTQPSISWLPRTKKQIVEKEHRQKEPRLLIDNEECDQISSDSEPMEVQHSSHQQEHSSCKRQRLS